MAEQPKDDPYAHEEAFDALVREHYADLFDFAFALTKSAPAAEDVVQDVFLNVWEQGADWRPTSSIRAYLFTAVRNRSLNALRRDKRHADLPRATPSPVVRPDDEAALSDLIRAYRSALDDMPERRGEVFRLSRLYGLTYEEIGVVLDISTNTVRTHMKAALEQLRIRLSDFL